jgi:hypothetical protein
MSEIVKIRASDFTPGPEVGRGEINRHAREISVGSLRAASHKFKSAIFVSQFLEEIRRIPTVWGPFPLSEIVDLSKACGLVVDCRATVDSLEPRNPTPYAIHL